MKGNEARNLFLEYFKKHQHRHVRSSSLVPHDDPTLLFTNAGMVQFKRVFIGEEKRDYVTATTAQKCVRAGGKHNDLENVGYTARHHTFFEMLGNFSFGEYSKDKAIEYAWDLLTNGYRLPIDKLWISIYLDDDEAFDIWHKKMGVPEERIVRLGEKENFWAMGETGPCGPCTEIHIDRGVDFGCGRPDCKLGCECDRFLEIWNLVFMQFLRETADGELKPLPKLSIDTGMGLERIVSVMQNAPTNYETDLFIPIIQKVEDLTGRKIKESREIEVAMKVIADHSRAAAFLIGDGVLPSNDGRGYVLRRIMRRAIRYGRHLGLKKPFLHETSRVVFEIMADAYPELQQETTYIIKVIQHEEQRFSETLDNGLALLNETLEEINKAQSTVIPGDIMFKLYDTFGFPVDIIEDVVKDQAITLDMVGFQKAMAEQREKSKKVVSFGKMSEAYRKLSAEGIKTDFRGYEDIQMTSTVLVLVKDGEEISNAEKGAQIEIVTAATPFYGESGGQAGDKGTILTDNCEVAIFDTLKHPTGLYIHKGEVQKGELKKGESVSLQVDAQARQQTALNHTATHLIHAGLREVLGDHVKQAGSLVNAERLRFDFSHFSMVSPEEIEAVEQYVNTKIRENSPVGVKEMDTEDALKTGATALFEEKYGDRVRVVSIEAYSKEFCGGTHAQRTGDIGFFKIINETSIAAGVRRIEAVTGAAAFDYIQEAFKLIESTAQIVKGTSETLVTKVQALSDKYRQTEKELSQLKAQIASSSLNRLEEDIRLVAGVKVVAKKVKVEKPPELRDLADKYRDKLQSGVIVLGAPVGPAKVLLIAVVTKDLTGRFHAGNIVKEVAQTVGGGGGGRPDMAQAGGTIPAKIDEALENVYTLIGGQE